MKNGIKALLIICAVLLGGTAFGQNLKFGIINTQEVISKMPERDSAEAKLMKLRNELGSQIEALQVELNQKYQAYAQGREKMADLVRQNKEKEIQDLQQRIQEYGQNAESELGKQQSALLKPIVEKITDAIKAVGKANGFAYIFDTAVPSLAYYDSAMAVDVLPLVIKQLGIKEKPAAPAAGKK
ncbi:OmpH family outer membrane protein [Acetobacteroides hydrogenigenes]|uniref:Outer membrane protein n=1 Tax=Acetobacteroides hydrogenigenes TaxID=979970 RepID=A0A4R2EUG1_9BACT|nr:OmpH family outer membrane protein [Acetobacteroides hydrogenigenes]TCN72939.1 outer membrane protein [Acetobacteroides hydrogenigenes]